jgi:hypothetical protein
MKMSAFSKILWIFFFVLFLTLTNNVSLSLAENPTNFVDSGQNLGNNTSYDAVLSDLDGDGDLDAFVANHDKPNKVWLNNGLGKFSDSGQSLGNYFSLDAGLGDLDGDGDLDAFLTNYGRPNEVWLNNGSGFFSDSGQILGSEFSFGVGLGDLDGDGDLDACIANWAETTNNGPNKVWLNNGSGGFRDSRQILGSEGSYDVGLGDLDDDRDLDVFITNFEQFNKVWFNSVDLTPPNIMVLSFENQTYSVDSFPLNFTVAETTSWMGFSLDGQANVTIFGNITLSSHVDGLHSLVVYAADAGGNIGASNTVYFTVDSTSPSVSVVSQSPLQDHVGSEDEVEVSVNVTDVVSGVKQVILRCTNGNGTWFSVNMTNVSGNTWSGTITSFPGGTNVAYEIKAEDKENNVITTTEASYQVIEDTAQGLLLDSSIFYPILGAGIASVFWVTLYLLSKRKK